jgi:hypothetical protein
MRGWKKFGDSCGGDSKLETRNLHLHIFTSSHYPPLLHRIAKEALGFDLIGDDFGHLLFPA